MVLNPSAAAEMAMTRPLVACALQTLGIDGYLQQFRTRIKEL